MLSERRRRIGRRLGALLCVSVSACACQAGLPAGSADARPYLPPAGRIFAGLSGGTAVAPFQALVGKHPPVFETFMTWDTGTGWLAHRDPAFRSRLAIHIGTASGYGRAGVITPAAIAHGRSDRFLVALNRNLARSGRIVYVRLMAEMNGYWNAYAAFARSGAYRGPQNAPREYVAAWRRTVLILRGGWVQRIDARLRRLGLPTIRRAAVSAAARGRLPRPRIAFLWVPQDAGSPEIAANSPVAFWPGAAYVDWVGTDFYASYPDFALLSAFYRRFTGKPFVVSEWAEYGADDPAFIRQLFAWVRSHRRVRMLNYYQGFTASSPADLARYPASRMALRRELRSATFLAYAPEFARAPRRPPRAPRPPLPPVIGLPPNPVAGPGGPNPPALCLKLLKVCLPGL